MKNARKRNELFELLKASNTVNQKRNRILILAVTLVIFVLFSAFSIGKGKAVIDAVKSVRENGSAASAYLDNGEEEQYKELTALNYIRCIGKEYAVGEWMQDDTVLASCKVLDKAGYEEIVKPAYDQITGDYPEAEHEVMVSQKLLKSLGILEPQLGMSVSIPMQFNSWSLNDGNILTEEFTLSGYYSDYKDEAEHIPMAYMSEEYLKEKQIPTYPAKLQLAFRSGLWDRTSMEKRLYRDVPLTNETQQFVSGNSAGFQTVYQMAGGYAVAILCTILVLISTYLLIYNVLSISLNKDIKYYGLLLTVGLTQKQLKKLVFRQNRMILLKGIGAGTCLSLAAAGFGFPILFRGLFLEQKGTIDVSLIFYPEILAGVVLVVAVLMLTASRHTIRKLEKLSPMEAYRYGPTQTPQYKKRKFGQGASIRHLAWRNLFRSKRQFYITMISLFLGCQVALLCVFILNGTDTMNELMQKPDFRIGTQKEAVDLYLSPERRVQPLDTDGSEALFDETFLNQITELLELERTSVREVYGCYGSYESKAEFMRPLEMAAYGTGNSNTFVTIQVIDEQYLEQLGNYVKANNLNIDMDSLQDGSGILIAHPHTLSESLVFEANEMTGTPAWIYAAGGMATSETKGIEFSCSGYVDITEKDFPPLDMSWNEDGINYLLVSERGFKKLDLPKQVFAVTVDAKKGQEAVAKEKITRLVQEKNGQQEAANIYYFSGASDEIAAKKNYINNSKTVMFALCFSLFLLGITNYINVIVTNMISRKKECAIMKCSNQFGHCYYIFLNFRSDCNNCVLTSYL